LVGRWHGKAEVGVPRGARPVGVRGVSVAGARRVTRGAMLIGRRVSHDEWKGIDEGGRVNEKECIKQLSQMQ
jgi:hypothetical protein